MCVKQESYKMERFTCFASVAFMIVAQFQNADATMLRVIKYFETAQVHIKRYHIRLCGEWKVTSIHDKGAILLRFMFPNSIHLACTPGGVITPIALNQC